MISKNDLKQYIAMQIKLNRIKKKLEELEKKPIKVVKDSVKASSRQFPYTSYTYTSEGFENSRNKNIYKKMLRSKKEQLEKKTNNVIYELEKMEDEEISLILTFKYIDGMNYIQIADKMNEDGKGKKRKNEVYTDESIRKQIERFFKKI